MRTLVTLIAGCFVLSGCMTLPDGSSLPSKADVRPQIAIPTRVHFRSVVSDVEPVVETLCQRVDSSRNCDFLITVDDTPGAQANAYQTIDVRGRPVIAFTVALLGDMQNDDEFAFVLAHEASHHIAGHLERTQRNAALGAMIFGELAGAFGGGIPSDVQTAQKIGATVASRAYSKDYELEADSMAARIVTIAGYDALHGAEFFARIPDPGDRFLGTHPANADRVAAVRHALGSM